MSAIEVFFSYSHKDDNLREELEKHLKVLQRQGVIKAWNDRRIAAGSEWEKQIHLSLQRAQIIDRKFHCQAVSQKGIQN